MNLDIINPEVKSEIIRRFMLLTPESKPLWGKMNVSQMFAHCNAQINVALGDSKLPPSIIGKLFGKWMRKAVLSTKPYSRNLPTAPSFVVKESPDFESARNKLIATINKFDTVTVSKEPHPFFGKMSVDDWSRSTWKHMDHHLKQFGV